MTFILTLITSTPYLLGALSGIGVAWLMDLVIQVYVK